MRLLEYRLKNRPGRASARELWARLEVEESDICEQFDVGELYDTMLHDANGLGAIKIWAPPSVIPPQIPLSPKKSKKAGKKHAAPDVLLSPSPLLTPASGGSTHDIQTKHPRLSSPGVPSQELETTYKTIPVIDLTDEDVKETVVLDFT